MLPNIKKFRRATNKLARLPMLFAGLALFIMMWMTFFDVILRSAFNNPIEQTTELTRILMAAIVFSCLPVISARGDHIVVDLLDSFFSSTAGRIRDGFIYMIFGGLLFLPAGRILVLAERSREFGNTTEYIHLPQFLISYFILVSVVVTAISMLLHGLFLLLNVAQNSDEDSLKDNSC